MCLLCSSLLAHPPFHLYQSLKSGVDTPRSAVAETLVEIGTALVAQTFTGLLADGFHGDFQNDLF